MKRTAPSVLLTGSNGSSTRKRLAVAGISCIRPCAPLGETAPESPPDSTLAIAASRSGSMLYSSAAARNKRSLSARVRPDGPTCARAEVAPISANDTAAAIMVLRTPTRCLWPSLQTCAQYSYHSERRSCISNDLRDRRRFLQLVLVNQFLRNVHRIARAEPRRHQAAGYHRQQREHRGLLARLDSLVSHHRAVGLD